MIGDPHLTACWLRELAHQMGFAHVALAPVEAVERHDLFLAWLAADRAGEMHYLRRDAAARRSPAALLPEARTVVCVALSYAHPVPDEDRDMDRDGPARLRGQIARYARGEDYHLVLRHRLGQLAARIAAERGGALAYRVCVDSAPVLEREVAARAGLGFFGKNTLLITPGVGSYTVLGELLLSLDAEAGGPQAPRCGACRLCLDVCPTGALISPYEIDARRCISYLTIENTGPIPRALRRGVGTWIFGCDACQEICPWNATERTGDPALRPRSGHALPELVPLLRIGAAQLRRFVKRTALRRIHRAQLLRNVAVALGNAGTLAEVPALREALAEPAALVRGHVAWALGQIGARDERGREAARASLLAALAAEEDAWVREELVAALAEIEESATARRP
jgi:epoxyqueuosine reductase